MRRLIIEAEVSEAARLFDEPILEEIEFMEVLNFLKEGPKEFALICRLKFKNLPATLKDFPFGIEDEVRLLDHAKDGSFTFFYRGRPNKGTRARGFWTAGGYLSTPFEIREGKIRLTFLGNAHEIRSFIDFIQTSGIHHKVNSLMDAKFPPNSPLSSLTDKQRKVLTTAFALGYYDIPRKIDSNELAKKLGISNPTLIMHRRKAERRILTEMLRESR